MMQYKVEEHKIVDVLKKITLPDYQRNLVWPKKTKKKFIESLILEYPIGVLTAYENKIAENNQLVIIDGLQRLSTIMTFLDKPSDIISYSELTTRLNVEVKDVYDGLTNNENKYIHNYFQNWYEGLENIDKTLTKLGEFEFIMELVNKAKEELDGLDLMQYSTLILNRFNLIKDSILFTSSTIPFIVCLDVVDEELPTVFESMNTGSVKLSKYEIYVSQWHNFGEFEISNELIKHDVINLKKERYAKVFSLKIEELEPEQLKSFDKVYLQDVLIYYSELMKEKLGIENKKSDELAFELLSLVCTNKVYGINNMVHAKLVEEEAGKIKYRGEIGNYIISILESIKTIINDSRIDLDSKYKFKNYFIIATLFGLSREMDFELLKLKKIEISDEMFNYVHEHEEKFKEERQVSYLHGLIRLAIGNYNKNREVQASDNIVPETVKLVKITHAGNPHPTDKLRIQVVPSRLRSDRNRGLYSEVFGEYIDADITVYVKFSFDHAIASDAKNKSIYVQKTDLDNFAQSNLSSYVINENGVEALYSKEEFEKQFIIY